MSDQMKVSVVIPTFNSEITVNDCLFSLYNQTYPPYEVIVVDGGSLDSTIEKIREFRDIKLIQTKEDTPGIARNRGVEVANGDLIFFFDSDCIADKRNLEYHLRAYQKRDDIIGVMGSIRRVKVSTLVSDFRQRQMIRSEWMGNLHKDGTLKSYLNTANLTIEKNIFLENKFREDLISCEDGELFIRLKQKGYKILYEPRAVSYHHHPTTIKQLFKQFMWYGQGFFQIDTIYNKKSRNRYQTVSPIRYLDFTEDQLTEAVVLDNRLLCTGCAFEKLQKCMIITKQLLKKKSTSEVDLHRVVCLALAAGILKQRIGINYERVSGRQENIT